MGRILNSIRDKLGFNRKKIKVTYYDEYNKEHDLRAAIRDGKIQLVKETNEGAINLNANVVGRPLWDKGDRYIIVHGLSETINPLQLVSDNFAKLRGLEEQSQSESFELGVKFGERFSKKNTEKLMQYILIAVAGVGVITIVMAFLYFREFDALKEMVTTLGGNVGAIKAAIIP